MKINNYMKKREEINRQILKEEEEKEILPSSISGADHEQGSDNEKEKESEEEMSEKENESEEREREKEGEEEGKNKRVNRLVSMAAVAPHDDTKWEWGGREAAHEGQKARIVKVIVGV